MTSFFLLIKTIVFLLAIILLIRITLIYVDKYSKNKSQNIKIIEKVSLGKDTSIAIIFLCGNYFLMSISQTENKIIKELNDAEVKELEMKILLEQEKTQKKNQEFTAFFKNVVKRDVKKGIKNEKTN